MIDDRRVLAVITARGGSKGLPRKSLLPIGGLPLIGWTIRAAKASLRIDRLILSSDDPDIIDAANALGCDAPFVRAEHLASDVATSLDVVLDAVDRVSGYDIVVLLQPTSPLRSSEDIDGTLDLLKDRPSAVSVTPPDVHPWIVYQADCSGALSPYISGQDVVAARRQDMPAAWALNGAVYAADIEWLRKNRGFVRAGQTGFWPMPSAASIDIDTEQDLIEARRIFDSGLAH